MNQDGYSTCISIHRLGNLESYKQIQTITKVSERNIILFFTFMGFLNPQPHIWNPRPFMFVAVNCGFDMKQ